MRASNILLCGAFAFLSGLPARIAFFGERESVTPRKQTAPRAHVEWTGSEVLRGAHYIRGHAGERYTLVEYFDYQCPACRANFLKYEVQLERLPNGVAFAVHNFPLPMHPRAVPAAALALAAEQRGRLAEVHRALMIADAALSDSTLLSVETRFGLTIRADLERLAAAEGRNASEMGVDSTPTFALCEPTGRVREVKEPSEVAGLIGR